LAASAVNYFPISLSLRVNHMKLSAILLQAIYLVVATATLLFVGSWFTGKYAFFLLMIGDG